MESYDVTSLFTLPKNFKIVASEIYQENGEDSVQIDFEEHGSFHLVMIFPRREILLSSGLLMEDETYLADMVTEKFNELKKYISDKE